MQTTVNANNSSVQVITELLGMIPLLLSFGLMITSLLVIDDWECSFIYPTNVHQLLVASCTLFGLALVSYLGSICIPRYVNVCTKTLSYIILLTGIGCWIAAMTFLIMTTNHIADGRNSTSTNVIKMKDPKIISIKCYDVKLIFIGASGGVSLTFAVMSLISEIPVSPTLV